MKACPKCSQPMISSGSSGIGVCGRCLLADDTTKALKLAGAAIHGETGRNENETTMDLSKFEDTEKVSQSFAYWAVGEDVAMLMASEISGHRLTYTEGRPARFWPNTEETHVNYRGKTVGGLV